MFHFAVQNKIVFDFFLEKEGILVLLFPEKEGWKCM